MLLAITLAITMVDYLQHAIDEIVSTNQTILYLFYTWEFRLSQFYPLAIVFSAVITYMNFIGSNTLVSLLSFGYTRRQLFIPFVLPALILYMILLLLQSGEFSYAKGRAQSILNQTQNTRIVNDLFFKYNDSFVYVKELDPIKKIIQNVTVFEIVDKKVHRAITLEHAKFNGRYWIAGSAIETSKRYATDGTLDGFLSKELSNYRLLEGYRPKVIELIYEGDSLSLLDALQTYQILEKQSLDSSKIRSTFYLQVILPLFSFAIMTFLFFKTSYYDRYMKKELVWALSLGGTLVVWGLLYALHSLGSGGVVSPEIATILPVFVLLAYATCLYLGEKEKLV